MRARYINISRKLYRHDSGAALVEFAYSLPILLALGFGGLETANLAIAHMRISQTAMLVADNASRVRTRISEGDVAEIFTGAELSAKNIQNFKAQSKIYLSDLEPNGLAGASAGQYIRWQCKWGDGNLTTSYGAKGDGKTNATLKLGMGSPTNKITAGSGTAVMFVEVVYNYQPLISDALFGSKVIRYTSAFNVRERVNQQLQDSGSQGLCSTSD